MSTPINSSNSSNAALNSAGVSPALNDLMSRLNAQANGADTENPQQAFSRWLEKHAIVGESARTPEAPAQPSQNPMSASPLQGGMSASRMAEQALARARQQTASPAVKPVEHSETQAHASEEAQAEKPKNGTNSTNKAARKDAGSKPASTDKTAKSEVDEEKGAADETAFNTSMGEGAAMVRELTPPPQIQPGDSAGMMAWLASLTNGDAHAAGESALPSDGGLSGDAKNYDGKGTEAGLTDVMARGKASGHGAQQSVALDVQMLQSLGGKADALADQLGKAMGGGRGDSDALSGLMAGNAMKGAGFGQVLNEASQSVRHETATLSVPFGSTDFAQALAEKVSMWVGSAKADGSMTAELHLNPAEMGPINVKISLDGQSAQVDFAAAALETRQAIEASLPMLSSALNDVGLSMTGGDVSSQTSQQAFEQSFAQQGAASGRGPGGRMASASDEDAEALSVRQVSAPRPGRLGGLDLYA